MVYCVARVWLMVIVVDVRLCAVCSDVQWWLWEFIVVFFFFFLFFVFFFFCFSFFFQAEDGIRDTSVTGVQTCALPICYAGANHYRMNNTPAYCIPQD